MFEIVTAYGGFRRRKNAEGSHDEAVTKGVDKNPKSDYNILRMKNPISDISG